MGQRHFGGRRDQNSAHRRRPGRPVKWPRSAVRPLDGFTLRRPAGLPPNEQGRPEHSAEGPTRQHLLEQDSAMPPVSLEAFLHEYRITFPMGVDEHQPGIDTPVTMRRYQLQGTPSLIMIDRAGFVRASAFGQHDDLALGALLGRLLHEPHPLGDSDSPETQ
jgi:hypothetical protein